MNITITMERGSMGIDASGVGVETHSYPAGIVLAGPVDIDPNPILQYCTENTFNFDDFFSILNKEFKTLGEGDMDKESIYCIYKDEKVIYLHKDFKDVYEVMERIEQYLNEGVTLSGI